MRNLLITGNGAALILPCGSTVRFDIEDYDIVSKFAWYKSPQGYVIAKTKGKRHDRRCITMHGVVMMRPDGVIIDHINRDRTDNRKNNLRYCSHSQNNMNAGKKKARNGLPQSKYRGVSWSSRINKWQVVVRIDGKLKHLGSYVSELDAAAVASPYFKTHFHGSA